MLPKYLFRLSAIAFCADASAPVSSSANPSLCTICWNAADFPSSFPWSVLTDWCGLELLNLRSTDLAMSIGGDFLDKYVAGG